MRLADFDFELPRELIAARPPKPRDSARLLVMPAEDELADPRIADLPQLLRPAEVMVLNDIKPNWSGGGHPAVQPLAQRVFRGSLYS